MDIALPTAYACAPVSSVLSEAVFVVVVVVVIVIVLVVVIVVVIAVRRPTLSDGLFE
ncbi:MAG: hypothetical protein JRJ60_19605 [Deltaproteobacteria bacterium]|nr:hypothetical protein [Deltaproteobacteria bacterium]